MVRDIKWEIDYYGILLLPRGADFNEIKKNYRKLQIKFHPDKHRGSAENDLRITDITSAYDVLKDDVLRKKYDDFGKTMPFTCCGLRCITRATPRGKETSWMRPGHYESSISKRCFCSKECADDWELVKGYTPTVHSFAFDSSSPPPPPPPGSLKICPGCRINRKWHEGWVSYEEKSEKCCTDYCLYELLLRNGISADRCDNCYQVKKWNIRGIWDKKDGKVYCCEKEEKSGGLGTGSSGSNVLLVEKNSAIAAVTNALNQNPSITNSELENANQNWRNDILTAVDSAQITAIKNRVLADIQSKRNAKKNGSSDPLQTLKNSAIAEIDAELLKDPKIKNSELDSGNQNWGADIQNAGSENQIRQIKDKVLTDIEQKRQAKKQGGGGGSDQSQVLNNLRREAINQIKSELGKQPSIDESEITNRNWETEITQSVNENAIKEVRDQVLADIRNKRATKQEKSRLNELLTQAKQKENWSNYEKLAAILKQIKELQSSNAYQEKESEIQALEKRLQELDPIKYQKTNAGLLDQQIKNNGLTSDNMDSETQAAIAEAKADPTNNEKKSKAEEKIAQNSANNNLNVLITQAWKKIKKGSLKKKEKERIINEILQFISKNNYQVKAYKKQKQQVNKLLAELRGEKAQDNTQNPFWKKALAPLLIISLMGIVITGVLIWRRKQLKRKGRYN